MKKQSPKEMEKENAKKELMEILKPGDTVSCVLRHVSRSGMPREISFFAEGMRNIDWFMERILDMRRGKRDGIMVSGCGMDMGFHVVYNLSRALFQDDFTCTGQTDTAGRLAGRHDCPSNDHSNGDRNYAPHKHSDGGHALRHRWI